MLPDKVNALQLLLVHWLESSLSGSGTETCALGPDILAYGCMVGTCDRHTRVGVVIQCGISVLFRLWFEKSLRNYAQNDTFKNAESNASKLVSSYKSLLWNHSECTFFSCASLLNLFHNTPVRWWGFCTLSLLSALIYDWHAQELIFQSTQCLVLQIFKVKHPHKSTASWLLSSATN